MEDARDEDVGYGGGYGRRGEAARSKKGTRVLPHTNSLRSPSSSVSHTNFAPKPPPPYKPPPHTNHTQTGNAANTSQQLQLDFAILPSKSVKMPKAAAKSKGTGKVEKRRAKKDPNAPKRGLSAYMFFANEQRDNVREENPGVSFGQVGKILGERWKALSDKQRTPYETKAAADKKRYEDEKQAYNACDEEEESS
ncbi:hypothetical protein P8C59_003304 [Phyllachora maydis]|uniref:Non-histone chromosomal protein 6 n=1 Tax=Phyllachora maydis TaxID=1825666 RepID=A0AAD9I1A4_9PEZI|nr:hypothetical protein P8C59_003304 [Phyllachora maydis]